MYAEEKGRGAGIVPDLPESAEIVEVSARDGIQNERQILPMDTKLALIERALSAGLRRMEVASFVNPARVPQRSAPACRATAGRASSGSRSTRGGRSGRWRRGSTR